MDSHAPVDRRAFVVMELTLLALAAYYLFLVFAFFVNGLYQYAFGALWSERPPGVGDFPFAQLAQLGFVGSILVAVAMLLTTVGSVLVPVTSVWLTVLIRPEWASLRRHERLVWLVSTVVTLSAVVIMWSPVGRSMLIWIMD